MLYLLSINILATAVTVWDKYRAKNGKWRIPEKTLFIIAALGGTPLMYLTMRAIRHKTRKARFMLGLPLLLILQICAVILLYKTGVITHTIS